MPFVRSQPGKKPGDQQREQVEQQSGLQRESGLVGSTGGTLHEGRARPVAPTPAAPTPAEKPVSRAVNLSDYAAANVDKTRALAQRTASNVSQGARRAQSRLGQAQGEFRGLATQGPSLREGLSEAQQIQTQAAENQLGQADVRRYQDLTQGYQGPQALGEVDTNLSAILGATSQEGQLATTAEGQRGLLQQQVGDQAGYTAGAGALDASLIAGQAGGIQQAGRAAQAVGQRGLQAAESAGQLAQERTGELEQLQQQARQQLTQQFAGQEHQVQQQVEAQQAQATEKQRAFQNFTQQIPQFSKVQKSVDAAGQQMSSASKALAEALKYRDTRTSSNPFSSTSKKGGQRVTAARRRLAKAKAEYDKKLSEANQMAANYAQSLDPAQLGQFGLSAADFQGVFRAGKLDTGYVDAGLGAYEYQTYKGDDRGVLSAEDIQNRAFLGPSAGDVTAQGVMTEQQRQQLRALQQLATASGGKVETKI